MNINNDLWKVESGILKAPATILKKGVFCGSGGCFLYPDHVLRKYAKSWNKAPVTLNHPINDFYNYISVKEKPESKIGFLSDCRYENEAIKCQINITSKDPGIRQAVVECNEVSTGLFSNNAENPGKYRGKDYEACMIDIRPDHLAILSGEPGACSFADGCGIRANAENDDFCEDILYPPKMDKTGYATWQDRMRETGNIPKNETDDNPLLPPEAYKKERK